MTEPPLSLAPSERTDTDRFVRLIREVQVGQGRFRLFGPLWPASRRPATKPEWIGRAAPAEPLAPLA